MGRHATARTLAVAERTLAALRILVEEPHGLTAKELAARLGVSLSTAYNIINTLRKVGYADIRERGIVLVGPELLRLVPLLQEWQALLESGSRNSEIERLAERVGEYTEARAYVGAWVHGDVEVVYIHGRRGVRELPGLRRGFRGAAHALALGKVLLAERRDQDLPTWLREKPLPRFTPFTITDPDVLRKEISTVAAEGIALDRQEYAVGACCIAVPVPESIDQPSQMALAISVPVRRFEAECHVLATALLAMRAAVSRPEVLTK
jgi:acetyl-CoA synthetase